MSDDLAAAVREAFCTRCTIEDKRPDDEHDSCVQYCIVGDPKFILTAAKKLLSMERLGEKEIEQAGLSEMICNSVGGMSSVVYLTAWGQAYKAAQDRILGPSEGE